MLSKQTYQSSSRTLGLLALCAATLLSVGCSGNRTVGERIDDAVITSTIEAKLAADPEVSAFDVDVDTADGMVRLSGIVDDERARSEAVSLATGTKGVRGVVNDIEIGKQTLGERIDDSALTAKVKARLTADPEINSFRIDVDVDAHVVTLSGTVPSREVAEEALHLARGVKGVRDVKDRLRVEER